MNHSSWPMEKRTNTRGGRIDKLMTDLKKRRAPPNSTMTMSQSPTKTDSTTPLGKCSAFEAANKQRALMWTRTVQGKDRTYPNVHAAALHRVLTLAKRGCPRREVFLGITLMPHCEMQTLPGAHWRPSVIRVIDEHIRALETKRSAKCKLQAHIYSHARICEHAQRDTMLDRRVDFLFSSFANNCCIVVCESLVFSYIDALCLQ